MFIWLSKFVLVLLFLTNCLASNLPIQRTVRIIKGKPCHIDDYPYLVAIRGKNWSTKTYCGGTLINYQWVLTAAHCILNKLTTAEILIKYFRVFGQTGKSDIKSVFHENYIPKTNDNDIALLQLEVPIKVKEYSKLPTRPYSFKELSNRNLKCKSMGWGSQTPSLTFQNSLDPNIFLSDLMCAKLSIMNYERCRKAFQIVNYTVTINHLCAVSLKGQDTCQGDSGGPLVCNGTQIGIVSAGLGCGILGIPSFYLRVDHYLDWINQTIKTKETDDELLEKVLYSGNGALKSEILLLMVLVGILELILR